MIGKYQLNFLEQDLRDAFDARQKPMQRKMNYISGFVLVVIQTILSFRIGMVRKDEFHLIYVSTVLSYINILVNYKYQNISQFLIFIQAILISIQLSNNDYQGFVQEIIENKIELFLVGQGYGQLNVIILQALHKWYIRSFAFIIICFFGFIWSNTFFTSKLSYLIPLYLSTIFAIIAFYLWESFERENFCYLFIKNKSLIGWQRIIKDNIPQSMVFVTNPKKKGSSSIYQKNKGIQFRSIFNNICDKFLPINAKLKNNIFQKKANDLILKKPTCNVKIKEFNTKNSEDKQQNKQLGFFKNQEDNELIFNFVNKKFYDQFNIKEWVDIQRKSIAKSCQNNNYNSFFDEVLNQEDLYHKSGHRIWTESPIHQILFNNIFKNIQVSSKNFGEQSKQNGLYNSDDIEEQTKSLLEFLKLFIDKNENQSNDCQQNQNNLQKNQQIHSCSYSFQNSVKQLNCFYNPASPFFLLRQQFQEMNHEMSSKDKSNLQNVSQQKSNEQIQQQKKQQIQQNILKQYAMNDQNQYQFNDMVVSSHQSRPSKNLTPNFLTQASDKNIFTKQEIEGNTDDNNNLLSQKAKTGSFSLQIKKIDENSTQQIETQQQQLIGSITQKNQSLLISQIPSTTNKQKQKSIFKKEEDSQQNEDGYNNSERQQNYISDFHLQTTQNDEKQQLVDQQYTKNIELNKESDKLDLKQKIYQNNQDRAFKKNLLCVQENNLNIQNKGNKADNQLYKAQNIITKSQTQIEKEQNQIYNGQVCNEKQKNGLINNYYNSSQSSQDHNSQDYIKQTNKEDKQFNSDNQDQAIFFDIQMVRCLWGDEEGVLLIFNDISLKIINEKLKEIERFKDKMLSTVTHDLKTPLNSIIMILENSFEFDGLNKKQLKIILQNSQMLMSLINDILDYSQLRRDKFRLLIEEICLKQCIMDVVDLFEIQAEQKRIKINTIFVHLQQEYIMQDERRIKQILVNLIGNALKFTQQEGKIDVIVKQKQHECIQIAVRDTGTGISEEIQKKLFQFFNTFDHSECANNRHGIGLGLAICKQLNSQLGPWHEIKLKSKVDQGSKFTFCIYTNLINHEQLLQSMQQNSPKQQRKTIISNQSNILIHNKQVSNFSKGGETPSNFRNLQKIDEEYQQEFHQQNIKKDMTNYLQLPQSHTINNINPQQMSSIGLKQVQQSNGTAGKQLILENVYSNKSDFNSQYDLNNKSQVSPQIIISNHNKSIRIEDIQAENKYQLSRIQSKELQSSNQLFKERKNSRTNSKKGSFAITNQSQQYSSSNLNNQEQRIQIPRKSIKRDYIVLKGNKYKMLNYQRAFTMKQMVEDSDRRRKTTFFQKSQTIDPSKRKLNKKNQEFLQNKSSSQKSSNKIQFFSEKRIPEDYSTINFIKNDGMGIGVSITNSKAVSYNPQNINTFSTSFRQNNNTSNSNFAQSIQNSDLKKLEKKISLNSNFESYQNVLKPSRSDQKDKQKQINKFTLNNKKDMFVRIIPKNIPQKSNSFQEINANSNKNSDNEYCQSENFCEIEEFCKAGLYDISKQQTIKDVNPISPNRTNRMFTYTYNDLNVAQSIHVSPFDNIQISGQGKNEFVRQSIANLEFHFNSSNQHLKNSDEQKMIALERNIQQKTSIIDHSNKNNMYHQRNLRSANSADIQNQQVLEEYDSDNGIEMYQENYDDHQDNVENNESISENSIAIGSNMKVIENNVEKQMIWIQNDRKVQVEILKTLLQDYESVLIADDSPFNIFCLQQILSKQDNLNITVAYNGLEALNLYKQNRQQIIFMDLNMPVLDGYECLKGIRAFEEENKIEIKTKVIVITAFEYESFFRSFDGYLSKPIKLIDIINILQIFKSNQIDASSSQIQL